MAWDDDADERSLILRRVAEIKELSVNLSRGLRGVEKAVRSVPRNGSSEARQALVRVVACHLLGRIRNATPVTIARANYPSHPAVIKAVGAVRNFLQERAVVSAADTVTPGWAADLVGPSNASVFDLLTPASAYSRLAARGVRVGLVGESPMRLPMRTGSANISAGFVGEKQMIPVKGGALVNALLAGKKLAVISFYSEELAEASVPGIEAVVGAIIEHDTATYLDGILLGSAAGSAVQPPGLLFGVTPLAPATGGGQAAAIGDVSALLAAVSPAADPVLLMGDAERARLLGLVPGYAVLSILVTTALPANTVVAIDAAALATAEGDAPAIATGNEAVLVNDTAPGAPVASSPTTSLWQQNLIGLRFVQQVGWTMRASGKVAVVEPITW